MEAVADADDFFRLRHGFIPLPAAHRLAADIQQLRQGVLAQALPGPELLQLLSKSHTRSSCDWSRLRQCPKELTAGRPPGILAFAIVYQFPPDLTSNLPRHFRNLRLHPLLPRKKAEPSGREGQPPLLFRKKACKLENNPAGAKRRSATVRLLQSGPLVRRDVHEPTRSGSPPLP